MSIPTIEYSASDFDPVSYAIVSRNYEVISEYLASWIELDGDKDSCILRVWGCLDNCLDIVMNTPVHPDDPHDQVYLDILTDLAQTAYDDYRASGRMDEAARIIVERNYDRFRREILDDVKPNRNLGAARRDTSTPAAKRRASIDARSESIRFPARQRASKSSAKKKTSAKSTSCRSKSASKSKGARR